MYDHIWHILWEDLDGLNNVAINVPVLNKHNLIINKLKNNLITKVFNYFFMRVVSPSLTRVKVDEVVLCESPSVIGTSTYFFC